MTQEQAEHMTQEQAECVTAEFGTPLYLFNLDVLYRAGDSDG